MAPEDIEVEFLAFQESWRDDVLLREADIKAEYQDFCDAQRDAYLDELEAGE
jgi:hypothetical protein